MKYRRHQTTSADGNMTRICANSNRDMNDWIVTYDRGEDFVHALDITNLRGKSYKDGIIR
jgi:hypothetical protein